jgi:hypothetical protein
MKIESMFYLYNIIGVFIEYFIYERMYKSKNEIVKSIDNF